MPGQRFHRVQTAARIEPAGRWKERGDDLAIELYGQQQNPGDRPGPGGPRRVGGRGCSGFVHTAGPSSEDPVSARSVPSRGRARRDDRPDRCPGTSPSRRSAASRSVPSSMLVAVAAGGKARMTNELPAGSVPSRSATRCRSRRCTRCRTTELPTALLTTKPARASFSDPGGSGWFTAWTTRRRRPARAPRRMTARKSSLRRSRAAAGSTTCLAVAGIRRTASRGPCDGGTRGWPGRRGYASGAGTHGSGTGGGCSAGRCACPCSRLCFSWVSGLSDSHGWRSSGVSCGSHGGLWCLLPSCGSATWGDENMGTRRAPAASGRPSEGTQPSGGHLNRPPRPPTATIAAPCGRAPTSIEWRHAVPREMLATNDILWLGATLVSVPLLGSPVAVPVTAVGEVEAPAGAERHPQVEWLRVAVH
jgi:hypothetical protein